MRDRFVRRPLEDIFDRADLMQLAVGHHSDQISKRERLVAVMGDDDRGRFGLEQIVA